MPDPVLVTGASGFIGSAVCRHLLRHGFLVRALHRPSSDLSLLEGLAVERRAGDILAPDSQALARQVQALLDKLDSYL